MDIIQFTSEDITAILGYVGDLVAGFMPLIVVIFGIAIAFWIIERIIHRGKD